MDTLYTGSIHGFPKQHGALSNGISTGLGANLDQDGVLSLIVVLGGSLSLVALVFAFITYSFGYDNAAPGTNALLLLQESTDDGDDDDIAAARGEAYSWCHIHQDSMEACSGSLTLVKNNDDNFHSSVASQISQINLFSDLRSLAGTTLMNLLAALFMVQLLFIVGVGGVQDSELCISLGLSLQYLRVSVVCWLAAMCHHLYATVASIPCRDDPPTYLKYSIFAWGAPLVILGGAAFLQIGESHSLWNVAELTPFNCWFLGTKATVYTYGLPIVILLLLSGYYLVKAAIVARYTCSMQLEIKQREKMKRRRALQLMLFLKVSLIVGLVAGCGVASRVWKSPILWAIFCTGHSLQGLAVALSVACNCRVLKVYARKSHRQPKQQIAKSSSMQLLAPAPDPV